jgi:hypothetical protein
MSSEYIGKCSRKNWLWKPIKSSGEPPLGDDVPVGSILCRVVTKAPNGFGPSVSEALAALYENVMVSDNGAEISIFVRGVDSREKNIGAYNDLRSSIAKLCVLADSAVLSVKKSPSQIQESKCGK